MSHHEPTTDRSPCSDMGTAFQALLDGNAAALSAALEEHRASCSQCNQNYRAALELVRALPRLPRAELPAGFADRVTNAVLADRAITPTPGRTVRRALAWLAIAACVAAMIGVARPWSADG